MRTRNGCGRWRPILGVMAMATFGFSLVVEGGTPRPASPAAAEGQQIIVAGNGIPEGINLPVLSPITVDVRKTHSGYVVEFEDGVVAVGGANWEPFDGNSRALSACVITEQCAVCDKCIQYACTDNKCEYTPQNGGSIPYCDDGFWCNGDEMCDAGVCVDGTPPCGGGQVCDENADECVDPCAADLDCDDGDECTEDICGGNLVCRHVDVCTDGRCCSGEYPEAKFCEALTKPECDALDPPGTFLAVDEPCVVVEPSLNLNGCPKYGSGIAPAGDPVVEVGPISWLDCDNYFSMGDDYETQNYPDDLFMKVTFLRFAGGVLPISSARWSIGFHDQNGLLIVNVFWPDGINDSRGMAIKTVDFDPPLIVPTKGYISFRVQANFGLDGRVTLASTDEVDKGYNDPGVMWVDDAIVDNFLGECVNGPRDGRFCDIRNGHADCLPDGSCIDVPDVLMFELIGTKTTEPVAACCAADTAACTMELPWICLANGGTPQDVGTLCGICQDGQTACSDTLPCPEGEGPCELIPVCAEGACCDPDGGCVEYDDDALCISPNEWQGFGTNCDPNCCEQLARTGRDNCNMEIPPGHVINVPIVGGDPVTITITGDNSAATYDDYDTHCDSGIFNDEGGTKDPGWWELFSLDACAEIRLDLCCTDIDGDVLRPAWGNLVMTDSDDGNNICCDTWFGSNGVDPPIGIGRDTSGFARGAPFCDADNLWSTYGPLRAGKYQYPIYSAPGGTAAAPPGAQYQLHITVGACPVAACCVGETCSIVNELDCGDLDGYWHRGVVDCGTQPICSIPGSDGLCCTGSCCTGPGECLDEEPGGGPMTQGDCDLLPVGDYVGGAVCTADPPPCPVCAIEGAANCQLPDLTSPDLVMMSDLSMPPNGVVVADDFISLTAAPLTTVCTWGAYLDADEIRAAGAQNDGADCNDDVVDDFRIVVYPDAPSGGKPDWANPAGVSAVTVIAKGPLDSGWVDQLYAEAQMYAYQMELTDPIELEAERVYWLEITNNTAVDADEGRCMWHWAQTSNENNDFHMIGANIYGDPPKTEPYTQGMGRSGPAGDMAFCLNMAIDPAVPAPLGACCNCDTQTCTETALAGCLGEWNQKGGCPDSCDGVVPGDDCAVNPILVTNDPNFVYAYDSTCATNDGPESETSELGIIGFGADIWVHYVAPCNGKMHIHMCGTGNADNSFDTALAVYKDTNDPTHCACPGDEFFTRVGLAQDESCNGIADGGAGYLLPPPVVSVGNCLTVRAAGFDADSGTGTIKIGCEAVACSLSSPPLPDLRVGDFGSGSRSRYMSFRTGSTGLNEAMRVTFTNLPPPYNSYNGDQWFVGQPVEVTEASGSSGGTPPPTSWMAPLVCGTPHYDDWDQYGVVHVFDAGIIPGASYSIQGISDDCDLANEDYYSDPLVVNTSALGDVVGGSCENCPCSPPQGVVDFTDIGAIVEKFKNVPCVEGGGPGVPLKSRADIINSNISSPPPDKKIDFVDISTCVDAFRSQAPPLPGPQNHCP